MGFRRVVFAVATAVMITAAGGSAAAGPGDDPLEPFNRAMFAFNRTLVHGVVNPAVDTVGPWVPAPVVTGLGNAYSNLTEIEFILNNLLVGDLPGAGTSVARFSINSTAGIAGLFDVASPLGLHRTERDFGDSLCQTGLPPGHYLVLPFAGPSNVVAAAALTGGIALEVYGLSFISTTLAMADFIIIDLGGSAAALRYATDVPTEGADPYDVQRAEYRDYIERGCGPAVPGG